MFSPISVSRTQFLGVEALHTREVRNTHKLLYEHIMQIRSMPLLSNATIVLSFESNLAFEAQHLLHHLHSMNVQKWVSLAEGAHSELGWLTTHSRKEAMALILREALRTGRVAYSPHFFSLSMTRDEAKRRVSDEMRNFSVIVEPSKTHFGKPRKTYTGKLGGLQDDVVIAFQLVMIAIRTFFENPKYANFAKQSAVSHTTAGGEDGLGGLGGMF